MAIAIEWEPGRFAVPISGFDTDYFYLRKVSGGSLVVSAGRTWRLGNTVLNTGKLGVPWRWACGVSGAPLIDATRVTVGGTHVDGTVAAVGPTLTAGIQLG